MCHSLHLEDCGRAGTSSRSRKVEWQNTTVLDVDYLTAGLSLVILSQSVAEEVSISYTGKSLFPVGSRSPPGIPPASRRQALDPIQLDLIYLLPADDLRTCSRSLDTNNL